MKEDGDVAFPAITGNGYFYQRGMSIRDYFAGQALAGSLAGAELNNYISEESAKKFAAEAYILADAMLAEREKQS